MNVCAMTTGRPIDPVSLTALFQARETASTGTVVTHHGKVKAPGKQIPNFSRVLLEPVVDRPARVLFDLAAGALLRFDLNQVLVVHRLGTIFSKDSVLWVMVSSATRGPAFGACAHIVDAIKTEEAIRLIELP